MQLSTLADAQALDHEWIQTLQLFVACRLRTPKSAGGGGAPPSGIPPTLSNTQFLIDGIILSINDHPDRSRSSWAAVVGNLRTCHTRFTSLSLQLSNPTDSRQYAANQLMYSSLAVVQDLYIAWCLMDGVMKNCADLNALTELEWPKLVAGYMCPLWCFNASIDKTSSSSGNRQYLANAVEEFRGLLMDIARSWTSLKPLRVDTLRRCEEHVRQALRVASEGMSDHGGNNVTHQDGVWNFIASTRRGQEGTSSSNHSTRVAGPATTTTGVGGGAVLTGQKLLDAVVSQFYDAARCRLCCKHCGAFFTTEEGRSAHYGVHFFGRSQLHKGEVDPMVRLASPSSSSSFVRHVCLGPDDVSTTSTSLRSIGHSSAAFRDEGAAQVRVRTTEDLLSIRRGATGAAALQASAAPSASAGVAPRFKKRPRLNDIVVLDPSGVFHCHVCKLVLEPRPDGTTSEWVLDDVIEQWVGGDASTVLIHKGCADR